MFVSAHPGIVRVLLVNEAQVDSMQREILPCTPKALRRCCIHSWMPFDGQPQLTVWFALVSNSSQTVVLCMALGYLTQVESLQR